MVYICTMFTFENSEDFDLKKRLDELLVERGLFQSQSRAKAEILEGNVIVNGAIARKAGKPVSGDIKVELKRRSPYVSRGAYKLIKALDDFEIDLGGKVCCDLGASTGGFTQVMLERGAKKVYAVDVGYGQFAWKLRNDPRVILKERTNARFLTSRDFDEKIEFITCDLSFISLRLILPIVKKLLDLNGSSVCLIKPQFEAGRNRTKKGVVKSKEIHVDVLKNTIKFAKEANLYLKGLTYSPIKGPAGNIEFLAYFDFGIEKETDVNSVVDLAWKDLTEG